MYKAGLLIVLAGICSQPVVSEAVEPRTASVTVDCSIQVFRNGAVENAESHDDGIPLIEELDEAQLKRSNLFIVDLSDGDVPIIATVPDYFDGYQVFADLAILKKGSSFALCGGGIRFWKPGTEMLASYAYSRDARGRCVTRAVGRGGKIVLNGVRETDSGYSRVVCEFSNFRLSN